MFQFDAVFQSVLELPVQVKFVISEGIFHPLLKICAAVVPLAKMQLSGIVNCPATTEASESVLIFMLESRVSDEASK